MGIFRILNHYILGTNHQPREEGTTGLKYGHLSLCLAAPSRMCLFIGKGTDSPPGQLLTRSRDEDPWIFFLFSVGQVCLAWGTLSDLGEVRLCAGCKLALGLCGQLLLELCPSSGPFSVVLWARIRGFVHSSLPSCVCFSLQGQL